MNDNATKRLLDYDPETGLFRWKVNRSGYARKGTVAGCKFKDGYINIRLNGKRYQAHRLAWWYIHGKMPDRSIDHINGIRSDNRISNLREATARQNQQNRDRHRRGNLLGATRFKQSKKNPWRAQVVINGKKTHIGLFPTEKMAHEAYMAKLLNTRDE